MTVVVVGAGPAGAASALLLARAGIPVELVGRESSLERVFRGEGLMPAGLDALHEMGLDAVLDRVPSRVIASWDIWIDGEETLVVPEPVATLGSRAVRVVSQPALLRGILDEAGRHRSFTFRPGVRLAGLVRDERARVTGARLVDRYRTWELPAELVLACDGRGSSVRTHAGLEVERRSGDYEVLWFKLPAPERLLARNSFMIFVRTGAHPSLCYVSWDGLLQCGVVMPGGVTRSLGEGVWLDEALRSMPSWLAGHVRGHRDGIAGPTRLAVYVGRCPSWTAPGVLLLGDAAHPMSPVRAQGINLALRDAVVAANHVIPAMERREPAALDLACRSVQTEREPEVARAQRLQRREENGQGDVRSPGWRYALARRAARVLGKHRWAQRVWLYRQRDLRFGSCPVRLQVQAARAVGPAGGDGRCRRDEHG